ncbi:ATPase, histidine kinase-, DNA gyrase B (macronuclear) [Tetrahymena thermophila SB210]|uniref:ATPase, histidine kinase-, DNA gyrase B n=1 Tax=Tetrahymena thermophila (strain SB210) TaxID=312017 RepID=Q22KG1_TETTS|nr:ATPase, histidine kinase-, DNA gyrase B [Tetrahymena thermophila SB210]EAR85838.2 ATPase, histidine kinase-, DNA gyrase B [Tetrahymena thermophila SB210]|eukprot:XP_001033501.2 ATPase, histidine kinase-, DNA gyrase B [Tetrahymena thermophila SB210]
MNQLDIFGSQVSVRFQGSQIHKTKFGAFLTAILCSLILIRLGILISSVINGRNPTVLYQERQVQDPKMFVITPNTLSLALGVLDINYNYYIDNTLFTIQGVHKTKKNVYNSTTGKYDQVFNSKVFSLVNCTDDHVPDPQLREFFLKSQLNMHQCIPKDLVVEIEGQFNSDSYQELNFYFYKCSGQGCKDEKEIDALVDNNNIELLFTDVYFAPENKDDPFIRFSRDLYWITSQNLPREVNVYMRNNYVESDLGWVTSDISTQTYPSFSYSDNQIVDTSNGFFFHLVVRFEKEKENLYKRTYDNLFTIMSQIGGFSQILLTIFSFLCLRYSQIHLARSLINQSFDFQDITNKPNQGILISNPTQQQNNIETVENQAPQNRKIYQFYNPSPIKENSYQIASAQRDPGSPILISDRKDSKDYYTQRNDHEDISQQISKRHTLSAGKQLTDEQILNDYNKQQEVAQNRSSLNFNIFSYMLSFVTRLFSSFRNKKQVIDYGFKEIDNNLDIEYIIKKFIEVDKLKRIMLNDDQLALFNYIPKPQILYKVDTTQGAVIEKNSFFNKDDNLNDFEKFKKANYIMILAYTILKFLNILS